MILQLFLVLQILVITTFTHATQITKSDELTYSNQIKPLFESRCISCHSCYNAPCQFNLQSYEGLSRGATKKNVYDGLRLKSVNPSRLFIDAQTTEEWRQKGFHAVNNSNKSSENILLEMLRIRREYPNYKMLTSIEGSLTCPDKIEQTKILGIKNPELGMPFGFPPLSDVEFKKIEDWVTNGLKEKTETHLIDKSIRNQIKKWEDFFNKDNLKQKLVSRYLYEHFFLAHFYFPDNSKQFFRLIRSKSKCGPDVKEIATRRPNDDPQQLHFFYCFTPFKQPPVLKTHMPMLIDENKLSFLKKLFFEDQAWTVKTLPDYSSEVAQNPFIAYASIPASIRYKFLLSDAHFQVMTFIKGPVCNGTNAVNSIQEQFYTFFLDPQSDPMSDPEYQLQSQNLLTLPGNYGSDIEVTEVTKISNQITELREQYRKLRLSWLKKNKPNGLGVQDIWNGDRINNNAILTIFRHNDNAVVMKGAVGDLSKTVFVLDYSLFERLVYNLVVNFDVFGNVGHQLLTRVYMDYIRMEAEENFLLLISPENRQIYRQAWYQGLFTQAKMKYMFPEISKGEPTAVHYKNKKHQKTQAIHQLLESFTNEVRGEGDSLNWRNLSPAHIKMSLLSKNETLLKKISSIKSSDETPFAQYFPETAYLIIRQNNQIKDVYSVIHNREFQNISWIVAESFRRAPQEDTLTLKKGFWIAYPELIFNIEETQLKEFVADVKKIKSKSTYSAFQKKYEVAAQNENFWQIWDDLHNYMKKTHENDAEFGYLDLTRYLR